MASLATRTSNSLLASLNMLACSPNDTLNSANHGQMGTIQRKSETFINIS